MSHAVRTGDPAPAGARPARRAARSARLALAGLTFVLWIGFVAVLLADYLREQPAGRFEAPPLAREVTDLAVACFGAGEVHPPLGEFADAEFEAGVEIVARLIAAYAWRDFGSFLALRANDLEFAEQAQSLHHGELRALCVELGRRPEELPRAWNGLLRAYWDAYYVEAPIARFLPEATVITLQRGVPCGPLDAWEAEFDALCAARPGFQLRHRLMVPHRRSIERVRRDSIRGDTIRGNTIRGNTERLSWLDLQLAFEAHDAAAGWLIARFVWDARMEEWFLHRATTVLDGELRDDRRHLVL